jgi:hypothetical protein
MLPDLFALEKSIVCFGSLIHSSGDTASQILRMLPKLKGLRRDVFPMSSDELSAVSKNLVSLECTKGFDFDEDQVNLAELRFIRLETKNDSDLSRMIRLLENTCNSIPQGRDFLKHLFLKHTTTDSTLSPEKYVQLKTSLVRVIQVYFEN